MDDFGSVRPYRGEERYIFVSYAHLDRERIMPALRRLMEAGYRIWYDEGIDPGTEWDNNIATHIEACACVLAFISDNYLGSDNCKDELNFARDLRKDRLLVYLEPVQLPLGMAMRLNRLQAIHQYTYSHREDFYEKLLAVPMFAPCRAEARREAPSVPVPVPNRQPRLPRIRVLGLGGAGCNTLTRLTPRCAPGVETIAVNTDPQGLDAALAHRKLRLELDTRSMLARGVDASIAIVKHAASQRQEELIQLIEDADIVFVTCGLGGIAGSTLAPILAGFARGRGILTVGVVSMPFRFEGRQRSQLAGSTLEQLKQTTDLLVPLYNDQLLTLAPAGTTMAEAFTLADETLCQGVQGIADLMSAPGVVRLDLNDLRLAARERGMGYIGVGAAAGQGCAANAARQALQNPMLGTSLENARSVLVNITGTSALSIAEVDEASRLINASVNRQASVTLGTAVDEGLEGAARVTIIASGIEAQS